jgi:hypothetical protein
VNQIGKYTAAPGLHLKMKKLIHSIKSKGKAQNNLSPSSESALMRDRTVKNGEDALLQEESEDISGAVEAKLDSALGHCVIDEKVNESVTPAPNYEETSGNEPGSEDRIKVVSDAVG